MDKVKDILIIVFFIVIAANLDSNLDWNEDGIRWYGYDEGMEIATKKHLPVIIVAYADWCGYCEQYSKMFQDKDVEQAMKRVLAIKFNIDKQDGWEKNQDLKTKSVPRTYALDRAGHFIQNPNRASVEKYYFYWTGNKESLLDFIDYVATS